MLDFASFFSRGSSQRRLLDKIEPSHAQQLLREQTRRHFLSRGGFSLGAIALAALESGAGGSILGNRALGASADAGQDRGPEHFLSDERKASARRVIYIHLAGSPPQQETFDYKPELIKWDGKDAPASLIEGKTFAFIKGVPTMLGPRFPFAQHGQSGAWVSDRFPHLARHVDKMLFVKSMTTDQFNHAPAQLMTLTGQARFGYPSIGSWITYGLGSMNQNLPGFVVLLSGGQLPSAGKNAWGSGFLPSVHQGVQCRTTGDPVLYLSDPPGMDRATRRRSLDALKQLNHIQHQQTGDPETISRIEQYELAYRMQINAPQVMDIGQETSATLERYGAQPGESSFANNCLLARRLIENDVRFVNLFDWGWDVHGTGPHDDLIHKFPEKCAQTDRPIAALLDDLASRGLLEDTLVVWSGEFGRTAMNEARGGSKFLGRDHHPDCFSIWLAGGGIKGGTSFGATDEFANQVIQDPVTPHDLQATILFALGLDPERFSYPYQGLNARLIGPADDARVMRDWLSSVG